jgi:RNA polymerase sigma factor (sigma-70 family)
MNELNQLYQDCYDRLLAIGLSNGNNEEDTRDVINHTFLDFAEKKIDFSNIKNPQAYIITSFKRKMIDHYRVIKRLNLLSVENKFQEQNELSYLEKIEANEKDKALTEQLYKAFKNIPLRCQKVIYLKYFSKLSNKEIANVTGLSERSVYNNLSEGLKYLRRNFANKERHLSSLIRIKSALFFLYTFL